MKKYLLACSILLVYVITNAQGTPEIYITGTNKIAKSAAPKQVVDALNKTFPDAQAVEFYKPSKESIANGWKINETDNLGESDNVDYYTISFKRDGFQYYGLYKPDGTLVKSRYEEQVDKLPDAIRNSLKTAADAHPGYTIESKTYFKNTNYDKTQEYYEVIAKKGKETKRLFYSADGTLQKVKG